MSGTDVVLQPGDLLLSETGSAMSSRIYGLLILDPFPLKSQALLLGHKTYPHE